MLTELEIKEEPLDEHEYQQEMFNKEMFNKQQNLLKQLQMDFMKDELEDFESAIAGGNFHIVEEHEQIITVNAADMKTQDELKFIENFQAAAQNSTETGFDESCLKCLKNFNKHSDLVLHIRRNNCTSKKKCPVPMCCLTFIDTPSLLKHLNLHRENYFFCNKYCGDSFKTLPLLEDHETRVHKMNNPPKIRYKHFCSYCREGFKTELQLYVHWTDRSQGCGKLKYDIELCCNNISKKNNPKSSVAKVKQRAPITYTPVVTNTIPITKLRLKSNVPSLEPPLKRQKKISFDGNSNNEHADHMKRVKLVEDLKSKIANNDGNLLNFDAEFKIKEEPLDEEEDESMNTTLPLMPEVIIKTEEDEKFATQYEPRKDQQVKVEIKEQPKQMKSLFIDNNKMMNPEFEGKIIPLTMFSKIPPLQMISNSNNNIIKNPYASNNNNVNSMPNNCNNNIIKNPYASNNNNVHSMPNNNTNNNNMIANKGLKNITNLKLVRLAPGSIASTGPKLGPSMQIIPIQQNGNNIQQQPPPKMSIQVIKLLPGTQLLTFKNGQPMQVNGVHQKPSMQPQAPITIMPKTAASLQHSNLKISQIGPAPPALVPTANFNSKSNAPAPYITGLNSTSSYSQEFIKLQAEAFMQAEKHRIQYIPKTSLAAIESLPEKKQLIDIMKQQIAKVATGGATSSSLLPPADNVAVKHHLPTKPPTLYLPLMSTIDVELIEARYQYPKYIYKWICPYCMKDYDIKRCLKGHLTKAHNLTNRDMNKINVQARAFKGEQIAINIGTDQYVKLEPAESLSDTICIKMEPNTSQQTNDTSSSTQTNDTSSLTQTNATSSSEPIKMSALNVMKSRYICDKCGRRCSSKTMLVDHISGNCSREPQYPCKECPKKFFSLSTLQCHYTIHTGELPHKCNYCEKRFRTRGQVTVHHRTHTGERPFVCQVCSQRFTHRETLIAHLSRHIGMKRYKCYGCDKHFSCISALKTHREIRPDTCGKVTFNPRAIGPRVRVVRGNVIFEAQPEINPYLRSDDPKNILAELQNQQESVK